LYPTVTSNQTKSKNWDTNIIFYLIRVYLLLFPCIYLPVRTVVCWHARPCQELQLTIEWVTRSIAIELLTTNCAPPGTEFYNQKPSALFIIYIINGKQVEVTRSIYVGTAVLSAKFVTSSGFFFHYCLLLLLLLYFLRNEIRMSGTHELILYYENKLRNAKELETMGAILHERNNIALN